MTSPLNQYSGRLTVDLGAIAQNWQGLNRISSSALTGAVVKADAYGTGVELVAPTLKRAGAEFFYVATLQEGIDLRQILPDVHIFVFNGIEPGTALKFSEQRLMPILNSMAMLDEWLTLCNDLGDALPSGLHFDTGMNRLGFRQQEASLVRARMEETGYKPQMVMSHLACADILGHEKNGTQRALFQSLMTHFPGIPASLANSAGILGGRENHFQMVRPGISLYGGRAIQGRANPMRAVVTLEMPILQIREARTGDAVGYGATQTLNRDSRLAIVGLGYADGFMRSLSSSNARPGARIAIRGKAMPVVGRVSMDMITVDITDLAPDIPLPGELAEIVGPNITIDDLGDSGGTIGYEILTSMRGRFERFYRNEQGQLLQN